MHFSYRIKANSLLLDNVRDIVDPAKEISEVKNAFAVYDQIDSYGLEDLLRLHGVMTCLAEEEGYSAV